MILSYIALVSALSISSVAAYFSILGFTTMFPGSFLAIIIMGCVLEVGKLACACLVHKGWKYLNLGMKYYLSFAVIILIAITSMGIFGFLSKSHIEHNSSVMQQESEINLIDTKLNNLNLNIKRKEDSIRMSESSRDINVNEMAALSSRVKDLDLRIKEIFDKGGFSRSKNVEQERERQKEEREQILSRQTYLSVRISEDQDEKLSKISSEIEQLMSQQSELNVKRTELLKNKQIIEAEVGPVKYIAELVGDISGTKVELAGTIRILILILVCVFDPLAVILLLAAGASIRKHREVTPAKKDRIILDQFLSDLEDYISRGGTPQKFIEMKR
tara:strand:+ start:9209 stop:10201 length:993 start_codon:yes stop_codon:yes gene_type:complete